MVDSFLKYNKCAFFNLFIHTRSCSSAFMFISETRNIQNAYLIASYPHYHCLDLSRIRTRPTASGASTRSSSSASTSAPARRTLTWRSSYVQDTSCPSTNTEPPAGHAVPHISVTQLWNIWKPKSSLYVLWTRSKQNANILYRRRKQSVITRIVICRTDKKRRYSRVLNKLSIQIMYT